MTCECKGHPFNCYNHPNDCGCKELAPIKLDNSQEFKDRMDAEYGKAKPEPMFTNHCKACDLNYKTFTRTDKHDCESYAGMKRRVDGTQIKVDSWPTIDNVPSCGMENDYQRAQPSWEEIAQKEFNNSQYGKHSSEKPDSVGISELPNFQYKLRSTGQDLGKLKSSHDGDSLFCFIIDGKEKCYIDSDIEIINNYTGAYEKEIWNAAIEAALSECNRISDTEVYANVVEYIRKLKK